MAKRPNRKKTDLASLEEIEETVKEVTGAGTQNDKHAGGRPPFKVKRVPLTTSLTEENKRNLLIYAALKGVSLADVLNEMIEDFFKENPVR